MAKCYCYSQRGQFNFVYRMGMGRWTSRFIVEPILLYKGHTIEYIRLIAKNAIMRSFINSRAGILNNTAHRMYYTQIIGNRSVLYYAAYNASKIEINHQIYINTILLRGVFGSKLMCICFTCRYVQQICL